MNPDTVDRAAYILHTKMPEYQRHLASARRIIEREVCTTAGVAVSFGKDSGVLLHLCLEVDPCVPVLFCNRGIEGGGEVPETYPLIERWKAEYSINLHTVRPRKTLFEIYQEYENPFSPETSRIMLARVKRAITIEPMERLRKELGLTTLFMGLRAEENPDTRGKMIRYKGPAFSKVNGVRVVNPLAYWTARDIWAYTFSTGIPYHPIYDKETIRSREEIRLSTWAGVAGRAYGRFAELRNNHPELWFELVETFKEARWMA